MPTHSKILGLSTIALAIGFNLPYANLAAIYDYPDVLRRPAGEALELFAAGGTGLVLTWHAFAFTALLLVPLSIGISLTVENLATSLRLSIAAAMTGALSGTAQAIGLWRWVFVVPELANAHHNGTPEAKAAAEAGFEILNAYGGIAIGEHLGQWLLVMFVLALAALQWRQNRRIVGATGYLTAAAIAIGTNEGLAVTLDKAGDLLSLFTIAGFLGLTLWLLLIGVTELGLGREPSGSAVQKLPLQ